MRQTNEWLATSQAVATSFTSSAIDLTHGIFWAAIADITNTTPSPVTFVSGVQEVDTFTLASKAGTGDGDYLVQKDTNGLSWAVALDTTGAAANTPTGAVWTAIPSGRKVYTDISGTSTAASVATAVKAAFNALSGFTAVVTASDAGADGTLVDTAVAPGVVGAPSVHNKNDSGAGSASVVVSITGTVTKVSPSADTVTVTAHGFLTGTKVQLTTTGTLPAGLATSTNYYLIAVDANTLAFATSQANALAGTKINITDYGIGTATITGQAVAGTIKIQKACDLFPSMGEPLGSPTWTDLTGSSQSIPSLPGTLDFGDSDYGYCQLRAVVTVTSGQITVTIKFNGKGA